MSAAIKNGTIAAPDCIWKADVPIRHESLKAARPALPKWNAITAPRRVERSGIPATGV